MVNRKREYALISVYNKRGIVGLAKNLIDLGYGIIATEGTGKELQKHDLPFIPCQKVSKNPKCFDGFMKTLSFSIEGGIIFDRKNSLHIKDAKKYGVMDINIVVCNFFPVKVVLEKFENRKTEEIVRYFDFGGRIMVKTAAQNYKNVLILVDPNDYSLIDHCFECDSILEKTRERSAIKAFRYIYNYDKDIIDFFNLRKNKK